MIGAGTFINPLFRIIVAVVVLGAVYLFIVRPILDTTNNAIDRAFDATQPALRQAQRLANQQGVNNFDTPHNASLQEANRLVRCVRRAAPDVQKIQACQP